MCFAQYPVAAEDVFSGKGISGRSERATPLAVATNVYLAVVDYSCRGWRREKNLGPAKNVDTESDSFVGQESTSPSNLNSFFDAVFWPTSCSVNKLIKMINGGFMKKTILFIMTCLAGLATSAFASTPTTFSVTTMQVTATVLPIVQVSATTINFGNVVAGDVSVVTASILITAPQGQPYTSIDLDRGLNPMGSTRRMAGPNMEYLAYEVFQDAAMHNAWGDDHFAPTRFVSGVGTGFTQQFDVYARLKTTQDTLAGDYSDTITVQVNY